MSKAIIFLSIATLANRFLSMSFTSLMAGRISAVVYEFQVGFYSKNDMSALLKVKNCIFSTSYILVSANKNISWKNQVFLSLFFIQKLARTILNALKVELSIF